MVGPVCIGMGRNTGNSAVMAHGYIGVYLELGSSNQMSSSCGAVGKFSSAVASWNN